MHWWSDGRVLMLLAVTIAIYFLLWSLSMPGHQTNQLMIPFVCVIPGWPLWSLSSTFLYLQVNVSPEEIRSSWMGSSLFLRLYGIVSPDYCYLSNHCHLVCTQDKIKLRQRRKTGVFVQTASEPPYCTISHISNRSWHSYDFICKCSSSIHNFSYWWVNDILT